MQAEITVKYHWKSQIALILAGTILNLMLVSGTAFAVVNPANLVQSGYWYIDEDIRAVLKSRLNAANSYVAPALPFESKDLLTDVIRDAVAEARKSGTALVPVNFSNTHWAALAIKRTNAGTIKVIYNDSLGSPIRAKANSALLAQILQQIDPNIEIVDLQVHQQTDGSSCGAFTAENLIKIAELDVSNLSDDQLKAVLTRINDATAIRNSHFYVLYEGEGVFDVTELKPRAEAVAGEVKSQTRQLIRNIINISGLTHDRLVHLNRASNFAGVSAGEDDLKHGVWVQGFMGSETDKNNVGSGVTKSNISSKSKLHGFVLGADTLLDEDTTIGLAFSHSQNTTKQKLQGILTNTDKISSNILSIYGSGAIDNDITVNGNIAFGKAIIKTTNQTAVNSANSINSSSKQKGDLLGGALIANYRLYANESIEISPRFGASYNQLTIKGHKDGSIRIGKTRQQELDINVGMVVSGFYDTDSFTLIPEINVDYSHGVWSKGNRVKISNLLDQTILTQKISNSKGIFRLGCGLTIAADRIEFGGGYERSIQGKSRSHIGYAKLRVNF